MNIHAKFTGEVAEGIEEIIRRGRAANKTEALRLTVLDYIQHHLQNDEDKLAVKRMQEMEKELKEGKKKALSKEDVLKKYPHLRDV